MEPDDPGPCDLRELARRKFPFAEYVGLAVEITPAMHLQAIDSAGCGIFGRGRGQHQVRLGEWDADSHRYPI